MKTNKLGDSLISTKNKNILQDRKYFYKVLKLLCTRLCIKELTMRCNKFLKGTFRESRKKMYAISE